MTTTRTAKTLILEVAGRAESLDVVSFFEGFGDETWRGAGRAFVLRQRGRFYFHPGVGSDTAGASAKLVGEVWA